MFQVELGSKVSIRDLTPPVPGDYTKRLFTESLKQRILTAMTKCLSVRIDPSGKQK
jgi:hypothetical protein